MDRDGTLVEDVHYLRRMEDLRLLPGAAGAVRRLNRAGWPVVVVTNQSGVARGYFAETFVEEVHRELDRRLAAEGARVDRWYYCPHHPEAGEGPYHRACRCRKPAPGMVERAAAELGLDPARSFVVGDGGVDLDLAAAVGARAVLVRTGQGRQTERRLAEGGGLAGVHVAEDLAAAAEWICGFSSSS
nr:HAD family hydrolase [Dissulfurirhabdus thermomarina]